LSLFARQHFYLVGYTLIYERTLKMDASMIAQLIVWILVGGLAGSIAAMLTGREQTGLKRLVNLLLGMAGAVVGGWLFALFQIDLGVLSQIAIAFDQVLAAIVGSLLVLLIVYLLRRWMAGRSLE